MSKVLIIGDLHIGARNNSTTFLEFMRSYFTKELYPLIEAEGVTHVIQLGDTLDKRKSIDFTVSAFLIKEWFSWFDDHDVQLWSVIGNHDTYYKSTNEVSGVKQYEPLFRNVHIVDEPTVLELGKTKFHLVPWVSPENKDRMEEYIAQAASEDGYRILCGHFELAGFLINRSFTSPHGTIETEALQGFDQVLSGHYHTPSINGNIEYVGTPYALTWSDYGDRKKVVLLSPDDPEHTRQDVVTRETLFHKVVFQDGMDASKLGLPKKAFLKVIIQEQSTMADVFVNDLMDLYDPSQCQVIDMSSADAEETTDELDILELDDPFQILMKSIESIGDPFISAELLSIYKEAQSMERQES